MNILQIVSSSRISGAEKHVVVLSDRLRERGHQVTVLCPPGGWLPDQLRSHEIPVVEMTMHGLRSCTTAGHLLRLIRRQQIEVIHSHLTCATYFGALAGRLAHLPVVTSVHVRTHDMVYRRFFPTRNNRIITVSDFLRDALLQQGIPPARIRTIYNGTDFCLRTPTTEDGSETQQSQTEAIVWQDPPACASAADTLPVRAELSLPPDAELIGLFGNVNDFKGHPILVRSVRQVVAARPRAYFVCVGAVQPKMQRILWEMAAADDVAERLRFTGVRNDVRRLMSEMDVITLPSLYEACSMSIIEAMALGKPVVATRAGGNPELVQDRETGLLIERTPEALAQALLLILADAQQRKQMGEAARRRAETRFSAAVMTKQIECLYQELLFPGTVETANS
jgi:glycosyltransferase involved in cell wall biosynthesis